MTNSNSIKSVSVFNINDDSKSLIVLKPQYYPTPQMGNAESLGTFVSGAIYLKETEMRQVEEILWNDVTEQLGEDTNTLTSKIIEGEIVIVDGTEWIISKVWTDYNGLTYGDIPNAENLKENELIEINGISYKVYRKTDTSIVLQDASSSDANGQPVFDENPASIWLHEFKKDEIIEANIIAVSVESEHDEAWLYPGQVATFEEMGVEGKEFEISDSSDFTKIVQTAVTDENGEIAVWKDKENQNLEGTYYVRAKGESEVKEFDLSQGTIHLPDVKYGSKLRICETKSPLGYIIGDACQIIEPKAEYNQSRVNNYRANKKIIWWEKGRKKIRIRKMGEL